ncbi:MAG TPA: hypothetical protein VKU00_01040, partial [Chthonomonadaceae bacterium]|nr:hypothetical protein [Chthonomonadaceae bacterium]
PSGIGFFTRTYPHHSAIIREVSEDGQVLDIFEQNYGGKRYVVESTLDLEELAQGWLRIYRPQ